MICPKCGAENRESAKFCLKCAQQLVPLGAAADALPAEPTTRQRKRRRATAEAQDLALQAPRAPRPGLYVFAGLLMASVAAWALFSIAAHTQPDSDASAERPAAARSAELNLTPRSDAPTSTVAASSVQRAEPAPSPSSRPAVASVSQAAPVAAPRPVPASERRPAPRRTASAPRPVPQVAEAPPPAPPPPAPAPRPTAPEPSAARLCADSGFITHAICLQRECGRADLRNHAQCVRMREQQKLLREGAGDH